MEKLGSYQAVGIRSKTKITEKVVKAAGKVSRSSPGVHRSPKSARIGADVCLLDLAGLIYSF